MLELKRFVFASSSAVYGDEPGSPKVEDKIGSPLSPYAASKIMNEIYAGVFARAYDFSFCRAAVFQCFGPRQDPEGAYAAVIPKWIRVTARSRTDVHQWRRGNQP